jgi:hypothetical protein
VPRHLASLAIVLSAALAGGAAAPSQPRLTGRVLDAACQPLPGVAVTLGDQPSVVTDQTGRFSGNMNAPTSMVRARLAGFRSVERELRRGSDTDVEVRLFMLVGALDEVARTDRERQYVVDPRREPEAVRLRGRVLDAACRPLAGAAVRVLSTNDVRHTVSDGRFEFSTITSGAEDIQVAAAGFVTTVVRGVRIDWKNGGSVEVPMDVGEAPERVTVFGR